MEMCEVAAGSAAQDHKDIKIKLAQHGVVLVRNQALDTGDFEAFTRRICATFHHVGTRDKLRSPHGDGFTTEVFHKNFILLAHSEGAYRPHRPAPAICFFLCLTPPQASGGETTLVDGVEMASLIPSSLRRRLLEKGIIYECHWRPERWRIEFALNTRAELCQLLNPLENVSYHFDGDDHLHLFYTTDAIHRYRGFDVFCNGLLTHLPAINHPHYTARPVYANPDNRIWFGDGEPFTDDIVNTLISAHDAILYRHRWCKHDLLIIDNHRFMHGREMTSEPCERVIISRFG